LPPRPEPPNRADRWRSKLKRKKPFLQEGLFEYRWTNRDGGLYLQP
jgi:hypothetical protein